MAETLQPQQPRRAAAPATRSTWSGPSPRRPASAATSCRATSTASARSSSRTPGDALGGRPDRRCRAELARYVVEKGSIAVDGVSLTVSRSVGDPSWFEVGLIPDHPARDHAGRASAAGDPVNLEVDVIAKYVERLLGGDDR